MLQATLTLPGIAAIALTLGMAIDSNVLINERIREELRWGATPHAALTAGYDRAFGTILDSNVTTLIAGIALLIFGTGPVRGFAVVHCLGIMTSMFSAVFVSRGIVNLIYGGRKHLANISIGQVWRPAATCRHAGEIERRARPPREPEPTMEFFRIQRDIPFMRFALTFNVISLVTFVLAVIFLAFRGLNLGVDFRGGTVIEVVYGHAVDFNRVRSAIDTLGLGDYAAQSFGRSDTALVRLPLKEGVSSAQLSERVMGALRADDPSARQQRVEFVGPQVGKELYENGALALLLSRSGIVGYLAMRFEWRFAVAAIIANLARHHHHPGLLRAVPVGVLAAGARRGARVLGYSVNESVVIADRIRENFRKMRKATVTHVIDNADHPHDLAHDHHARAHADDGAVDPVLRRRDAALLRA
jgi:preprotein translocase subunit SecF